MSEIQRGVKVFRYVKNTDYSQYAAFAIKISKLDATVNEFQLRQAIQPLSRAALSLSNCVARIRDYSPDIVDKLQEAFPQAVVEKIPRLEQKDRQFYISQVRLQKQLFQHYNSHLKLAFIIIKSTSEQSYHTENAIKFVKEITSKIAFTEMKIYSSGKHIEAMVANKNEFLNIDNKAVNCEIIQNKKRDDVSFKFIQIKGFIAASQLDDVVDRLCQLDTIPEFRAFDTEKKHEEVE